MDMNSRTVHSPTSATADPAWRDRKRRLWPLGVMVPTMPFAASGLVALTGWSIFWWIGPMIVFGIVPLLDQLTGLDQENPPEEVTKELEADRYYRWCTYAYIPLQFAGLVWAASLWATGDLSLFASLGLAITVGCVSGIAINTAHELGHKHPAVEKWLAKVALSQSAYGHFFLEHNRGHHVRVSTPEDPASSRFGEHLYEFLPRTVWGSLTSAIHLQRERDERLGQRFWSPTNDLLNAWAMSVVLFGGLIAVFGWSIAPWLAIQAVFGFLLLEVVNYVEHYGLLRQKKDNGRYERCQPEHSWNSTTTMSNLLLFQLQRHSDHHAFPTRRYQTLRHFDDVPQLPAGYSGMIVLALVPPLWRRVMDPRVLDFYDGDVTRANIHPRSRRRITSHYGIAT